MPEDPELRGQPFIQPLVAPFQKFLHAQSTGGVLLLIATVVALTWANSPWGHSYTTFWSTTLSLVVGSQELSKTLLEWINDGLMAMFFFVVGLEIKREVLVGELASLRQAALPLASGIGGIIMPAFLYWTMNASGPGSSGWAIPMATDIAFALGILALLGNRIPLTLKVFLTALAIGDDLMAILVIALFYTSTISGLALAVGVVFLILLMAANLAGIRHLLVYLILGIGGLWMAFLLSGVHATIAGVLAAMTIPARAQISERQFISKGKAFIERFEGVMSPGKASLANKEQHKVGQHLKAALEKTETPLQRFEYALHPWVMVVIMPLFALANAGVAFDAKVGSTLTSPVSMGVILGLLLGKPIGVVLFAWLAIRMDVAVLPEGVSWGHLVGVGCLAGIGFTMSLFIAGLAFDNSSLLVSAKVGVLFSSLMAGLIGWLLLRRL